MPPSKWENLSRCSTKLIHVCKNLSLALDYGQTKYSPERFNIYIFQFWAWLLQLLVIKKFWNNFWCIVFLFVWAQKVCLKSYFKLEILIVCPSWCLVQRYDWLKSSFSAENKHQPWNLKHTFVEKLSKFNWQNIKLELEFCKVIHDAKLHW